MKKTLSKEEALQYIIQNADKYNIPRAYIGADYLDDEKKYLYPQRFKPPPWCNAKGGTKINLSKLIIK